MVTRTPIDRERLAQFCQDWGVSELSLFGSVLRDDFRPESDIDVLVAFGPAARPSLLDLAAMAEELAAIFGHPVDLVTRKGVEQSSNWIRREGILGTAERVI